MSEKSRARGCPQRGLGTKDGSRAAAFALYASQAQGFYRLACSEQKTGNGVEREGPTQIIIRENFVRSRALTHATQHAHPQN